MSVTVYVEGWDQVEHTMVKEYMDELYPSLDAEDFRFDIELGTYKVEESTGRIYQMKRQYAEEYPELNLSNSNFASVLDLIGMSHLDQTVDSLDGERLNRFHRALLKAQNSKAKSASQDTSYTDGNMTSFVPGESYYTHRLDGLLKIVCFARQKGVGIYWA